MKTSPSWSHSLSAEPSKMAAHSLPELTETVEPPEFTHRTGTQQRPESPMITPSLQLARDEYMVHKLHQGDILKYFSIAALCPVHRDDSHCWLLRCNNNNEEL